MLLSTRPIGFWTRALSRRCSRVSRRSVLGLCLAGAVPWCAVAKEPTPAPRAVAEPPAPDANPATEFAWSLDALQQLALENNPTLNQAAASVDASRGLYKQVGIYPNPQLGYLRDDSNKANTTRTSGVFVGQEIVTAGKLRKARNAESWEVERGNWNYQAQTQRVLNDVQLRFLEVLAAKEGLKLAEQLTALAKRGVDVTQRAFDANQVAKSDLLQARIQMRTVELGRKEATARRDSAWKQLRAVVGCPDLPRQPLAGHLDGELPNFDWDTSYQRLLTDSPLMNAAKARSQHFQNSYVFERANAIPNLNVQVVAQKDYIQQATTVSTLLSVPFPVFNRNQGNIYRAAAETREAASEIRRTELALHDQLAETFRRYESAKAIVTQLDSDILPDAEESLKLTLAAYPDQVGILNVLSVRKTYFEAKQARVEALVEARRAAVEINGLLLTGALNPAEVGTALQSQPGATQRRAVLNQLQQEGNSSRMLPAALQTGGGP